MDLVEFYNVRHSVGVMELLLSVIWFLCLSPQHKVELILSVSGTPPWLSLLPPHLFVVFIDRNSRFSCREEGVRFGIFTFCRRSFNGVFRP